MLFKESFLCAFSLVCFGMCFMVSVAWIVIGTILIIASPDNNTAGAILITLGCVGVVWETIKLERHRRRQQIAVLNMALLHATSTHQTSTSQHPANTAEAHTINYINVHPQLMDYLQHNHAPCTYATAEVTLTTTDNAINCIHHSHDRNHSVSEHNITNDVISCEVDIEAPVRVHVDSLEGLKMVTVWEAV